MSIILIFETAGLISFSLSGIFSGLRKKIDVLGFFILALTTAIGGGIMRDLIIGYIPPIAFRTPFYISVSLLTTFLCYVIMRIINPYKYKIFIDKFLYFVQFFDAIGVGIFAISGVEIARELHPENSFLCAFVGVLTAIGGGMLRDVFVNQIPMVFKNELYATPIIIGTAMYIYLIKFLDVRIAMYICSLFIVIVRMAAIRYRIHLPTITFKKEP